MELYIKKFTELTLDELYDIIKLRIDVFIVEQKCPYHEADGIDKDAVHLFIKEEGKIIAYLRIMDRGIESEYVSIGRVIAAKRRCGLGSKLLSEGIKTAQELFGADTIYLEAQTYAEPFYRKAGFKRVSDEFDIDGIPHIKMLLTIVNNLPSTTD